MNLTNYFIFKNSNQEN